MKKASDFSGGHFDWLVQGRSQNQLSALALYKAIEAHEKSISQNVLFHFIAQSLAAVAFSLWRAVFLSDLTGDLGDQLTDIKSFLQNLIAHNAILYQTDFSTREWTFQYYLDNAIFRLKQISEEDSIGILPIADLNLDAIFAKDSWATAQAALDAAVSNFREILAEYDHL